MYDYDLIKLKCNTYVFHDPISPNVILMIDQDLRKSRCSINDWPKPKKTYPEY